MPRKDLERSALMMGKIKNPPKKETTYDGGLEAEGFNSYASKTTEKGGHGRKQITKTMRVDGDFIGNIYTPSNKQTLTKTKTVRKNDTETTKTKQKEISSRRANKIKQKIRKKDPSINFVE
jgi:hypothetical protein